MSQQEKPVKVLFVCLGNICRSPTAEGIFRAMLEERGLAGKIVHDSCGTGDWHCGQAPDRRAIAEAKRRGIDISDLRGRQVRASDFEDFDYLVAMDEDNHFELRRLCPPKLGQRVHYATSFAPGSGHEFVPDPYHGGADGFARVYDLLTSVSEGVLARIKKDHGIG